MAYNIALPKLETAVPSKRTKRNKPLSQRSSRPNPSPRSKGSIAESPKTRFDRRRDFQKPVSGDELEADMETRSNGDTESVAKVNCLI